MQTAGCRRRSGDYFSDIKHSHTRVVNCSLIAWLIKCRIVYGKWGIFVDLRIISASGGINFSK